jgi:hypothetical protein
MVQALSFVLSSSENEVHLYIVRAFNGRLGGIEFLLLRIPPPPGGTAILPKYIHYYGYYYQVIVQCLST